METPPSTAGQEEQELRERAFFSWAEFSRFFDAWCQQRLALFFVKSSMHLARCRWASAPPLYTLIDVLKYSYVRLVCKDVRAPSRPTVGPPQPGCPAFIIVKLSPLRDRLVVTECQLTHSHPACPLEFAYYFRPGHLLANACLPVRTTNKISKQFVAPADVHRLLSYCKGRDHGVLDALHVLEGLFRTDPEAKVKLVFVEDQAVVETVFFLTSRTRALLRRFPRMLLVDRLPGLQGALDLLAVLCVDGAGRAPSRSVAQCLRDLVAMQWADAAGEAAPEGPDGGGPWPEGEPGRRAHVEERMKGLESGDWGGAPKEGCIWRGAQLEKEWPRGLEARDRGGAQLESEMGRGFQVQDWRQAQLENQKVRGIEGSGWRGSQLENEHWRGPEIRDWRGSLLECEKDWEPEGYVRRGVQLEDHGLRGLKGYTWTTARLEDQRVRMLETTDRRGTQFDSERARSLEGSPWRGAQMHDERARGLKTREWKGPQLEADKGRGLEVRNWRGFHLKKPRELVPENGDQRGPQWGDERQRGPEIGEERGVSLGVKRRRDLEDVVLVQLGDTRMTGLENGEGAPSVGPKSRGGQGMECGGTGGRGLGLGNGVMCGTPMGTVFEGDPEWAGTRRVYLTTGESLQEGGEEEGPREPKRPCCASAEEEVDWEPLAKFRAACGPELAELVAEELAFARQHGTRGFHWTGAGFALKDGTSDFFLDRALTRCSCSIHAARRLPCRHLFAARLLTGAALFHMDLLRDCWGRAPEP
uniref:Zinc finger SWIM-type containing 9 n=1 Tax=Ailuropoda melanoleuca TaxID=9646 RepID=G1M976_AILME